MAAFSGHYAKDIGHAHAGTQEQAHRKCCKMGQGRQNNWVQTKKSKPSNLLVAEARAGDV
eukprot:365067-Chlamydomonas_euryale.AAC.28